MIVFDLTCHQGHVFEAWFKDSAAFEGQRKARQVLCAVCGSAKTRKAPMSPRLSKGKAVAPASAAPAQPSAEPPAEAFSNDPRVERARQLQAELAQLRQQVEKNCDYVGVRFPEEARRIHYGETKPRGIYGEATDKQASELVDEGIKVARVPWLPRRDA
jgi:hypothetical protein